jgi:hypothetical protein
MLPTINRIKSVESKERVQTSPAVLQRYNLYFSIHPNRHGAVDWPVTYELRAIPNDSIPFIGDERLQNSCKRMNVTESTVVRFATSRFTEIRLDSFCSSSCSGAPESVTTRTGRSHRMVGSCAGFASTPISDSLGIHFVNVVKREPCDWRPEVTHWGSPKSDSVPVTRAGRLCGVIPLVRFTRHCLHSGFSALLAAALAPRR